MRGKAAKAIRYNAARVIGKAVRQAIKDKPSFWRRVWLFLVGQRYRDPMFSERRAKNWVRRWYKTALSPDERGWYNEAMLWQRSER